MAVDAQRLRGTGLYEASEPLRTLLEDVDSITAVIDGWQAFRRKIRLWSFLFLLAAAGVYIAAIVEDVAALLAVGFFLFLSFIALLISSFVYSGVLIRNRSRHAVLQEMLAHIRHDAESSAKFSIRLALKPAPVLLSEAPWPARRSGKEQMLRENWIRVEGPLADGTDLTEEVTELMRKRTYLNRNGKRKSKIRSRYLLTVRAAYPQDRYGTLNSSTIAAHEAVRLPAQAVLRDARASEKDIRIKAVANAPQDIANTIAMMSLGAYRILNRPRRGDAA